VHIHSVPTIIVSYNKYNTMRTRDQAHIDKLPARKCLRKNEERALKKAEGCSGPRCKRLGSAGPC
jgi:hypothetical protein